MTARKMIWRMSPSTNGSTTLVGTMCVRNCHQCWVSPRWMSALTDSDALIVLTSAWTALPTGNRLMASRPNSIANRVPTWK
jgi:hypothetical protein